VNVVAISGNLTADPELRYTATGTPVCSMRLAHNMGKDDEPLFIDISAWERLADACAESLRKGMKVAVQGTLRPETWTDKEGNKRSKVSIRAISVDFLTPRPETSQETPRTTETEPDLPF
jgi:single-strand DNA-binding protein